MTAQASTKGSDANNAWMPPADPTAPAVDYQQPKKRGYRSLVLALIAAVVSVCVFVIPVPLVITTPGPTLDLSAQYNEHDLFTITGTDPDTGQSVALDKQHDGQLRMVTISEYGGPGHSVTLFDVIRLMSDGVSEMENYYDVYGNDVTADQVQSFSQALMTSSHSTSSVAALEALGWRIPATVTITGAVEGSDAQGKVLEGDVLVSVVTPDGHEHAIDSAGTVFAIMAKQPAGTKLTVNVKRNGADVPLTITSKESFDGIGSKLGIYLDIKTTMPVDVNFAVEDIGGPSAGMMFALAIIDKLTEGDLAGGKAVAGTGAISYDGRVEPIGGLPQKIAGARNDGAQYFLAPSLNCDELTSEPEGINVYRINTLTEALEALHAISAGDTDKLPACYKPTTPTQ